MTVFCQAYGECLDCVTDSNKDGGENIPPSTRGLVRGSIQEFFPDEIYVGKEIVELTEEEVETG